MPPDTSRTQAPTPTPVRPPAPTPRVVRVAPRLPVAGPPAVRLSSGTPSAVPEGSEGGEPLPPTIRKTLENSLQVNLQSVRVHTDSQAQNKVGKLSARAFTYGTHIFLGRGEQATDLGLIAHETAHVIQQQSAPMLQRWAITHSDPYEREAHQASAAVQLGASFNVRERTRTPRVQRWGIEDEALDIIADKANMIPGFRMFTIILGVNPINMSRVDPSPANILRALIEFLPGGGLITQVLNNTGAFEKVATWVEQQIRSLGLVGSSIKQALMDFVKSLKPADILDPGGVWDRAERIFTSPIDRIISLAKGMPPGILKLVKDVILPPIAKLAEGTEGYNLLKGILGEDPITGEAVPRSAETLLGPLMKMIGLGDVWEKMQQARAIPRCWAWFQSTIAQLLAIVSQIPPSFIAAFKSLTLEDIILIPKAFIKLGKVFVGFLGKFVSWGVTAMWNLLEIVFDVVSPGAFGYIKKTGAALKSILKNPLPFVGNLVKAAKLGFTNFAANFLTHLKAGLLNWLAGSLPGVYIPTALTLVEFGKLALSVFGVSWEQIRGKIVKALGPNGELIMKGLEEAFDVIVALVTGGPAAAWEVIKDKLTNLKDMIIDGIIGFIKETVVTKAIPKLIAMFIPGAGFISAIISIYDTVKVFIEKISKIIQVVTAFINSIVAIAAGNIGAAASKVENILAGLLSLAISFLAGFVLGNVAGKIMGVINKLWDKVDKALDTAIAWIINKAKALFARLFGKKDKPDTRTEAQKQKDLQLGISEADALLGMPDPNLEQVRKRLPTIKSKFKLSGLELIVDATTTDEETVHVYGEASPKKSAPKHKVKKGGPDSIISTADMNFDRPSFRAPTKRELRRLHIAQAGSKNIKDVEGKFKDVEGKFKGSEWHRRHVVSWGNMLSHFKEVFTDKTVKVAAAILAKEDVVVQEERPAVVREIKAKARNAFNDEKNLFIGLGKENSRLQEVLDDAHPDLLDQEGKRVAAKIDKKVAEFIAKHAIGGYPFKVTMGKGKEVEVISWDVTYE